MHLQTQPERGPELGAHSVEPEDPGDADNSVAEEQRQQQYPVGVKHTNAKSPGGDAAEELHQTKLRRQGDAGVECGEVEGARHTRHHVPTRVAGEQESLRHRGGEADRATEQHQVTGVNPEAIISHRDVLTTAGESLGRHRRRRLVGDVITAAVPSCAPLEYVIIVIDIIIVIIVVIVIVVCSGRGVGVGRVSMLLTVVQQKEKGRLRAAVLRRCLLAVRRLRGE